MTVLDGDHWAAAVGSIDETVSLAEFEATGTRLRRRDRKYVVDQVTAAMLVDRLLAEGPLRVLEIDGCRLFGYDSLYFDTADHQSLRSAAAGRPDRFKVRRRRYWETGRCLLEVKTRSRRGDTVKQRIDAVGFHDDLDLDDREFVAECLGANGASESLPTLVPSAFTRYQRATVLLGDARFTVDTDLTTAGRTRAWRRHRDVVVVETKTPGPPCAADRALWALGRRPVSMSKFAVAMLFDDPSLPANKWNRVLRRSFGWSR